MFKLRGFRKADDALIGIIAIFGAVLLLIVFVFMFFFMQMLIQNIIPIAIVIILLISVNIYAKGWYFKKTGKEYGGGSK